MSAISDPEKHASENSAVLDRPSDSENEQTIIGHDHIVDENDAGEKKVLAIRQRYRALRWLREWEQRLDKKMGIEGQGVERIPEEKRQPPSKLNMMLLWFSNLMSPGGIPIGILSSQMGLSLRTGITLTVFAALLGSAFPAYTSTFSAFSGLRQIAVSRYAFGIQGAKLCGFLNIIVNIGFGVVNCIVSGQLLRAVSGSTLPIEVGIVIIAVLGTVISIFGFKLIHTYERYAWIIIFILVIVHYAEAGSKFHFPNTPNTTSGIDYSAACLSYFAIVFGACTGWASMAGDYYVHYPPTTSKWMIFTFTLIGLTLPTVLNFVLGNCLGSVILTNGTVAAAYGDGGAGALILATLRPSGFGKFVCVMYSLSFLGNIIPIIYSSALSIQLWGKHFFAVPRFIWCIFLGIIMLALGLGGRDVLETIISNFLSLLGYWTVAYTVIMFEEHFWFRKHVLGGYDLTAWQDQARMPWGVAGTMALLAGLAFSFLGMNQTWYTGVVARKIGAGGDVGDYLSFFVAATFYPLFRTIEIKYTGR